MGVDEVAKPGKCLGIPMHVGRNKGEVFSFLTDRIQQKLQCWMNKDLSKAGTVTLLKSTAQLIPNFWMFSFSMSKDIIVVMERLMNGFH